MRVQQGPECFRLGQRARQAPRVRPQVLRWWRLTGSQQGDQTLETDSTVLLVFA